MFSIEDHFQLLLIKKFFSQTSFDDFIDFASVFILGTYRINIFSLFFPRLEDEI